MDAVRNASVASTRVRTQATYKQRWRTLCNNLKRPVIAFFASFGGFEYRCQQGVLGQSLVMTQFMNKLPSVIKSAATVGWLTFILQLGGILGSLSSAVFGESAREILGSYLYIGSTHHNLAMLYAGRFFTSLGVGTFSGVDPLYNAEIAPPKLRDLIVSFYQFATILGIILSSWIGYGNNDIGGIGEGQSNIAWMLLSIIQGIPAANLAIGIW